MTISRISLFSCFTRDTRERSTAQDAPSYLIPQFLKDNPITKACFHAVDRACNTLSGRIRKFDPRQCPIIRTCLSKKPADSLSLACSAGQIETVRRLLKAGADVNLVEKWANGPPQLHWACFKGHTEIVRLLLYAGANVHLAEKETGWTPLHWACFKGHTEIVKLLIEKKANLFAKDSEGYTPLDFTTEIQLLRVLTGTEGMKAFDACKDIHDFFALLFPPSKEVPPPNWESLLARIPKNPKLLELEKEKVRLEKASVQWPLIDEIFEQLAAIKTPVLSGEKILETLLKIHPLFAKAWELADHPDLNEIAANESQKVHPKGTNAFYSIGTHKINIENGSSEEKKLTSLVFETINAIQEASFVYVKKLDDLTREEYAFLSESVEYNSSYWRKIMIFDPKAAPVDHTRLWKIHNIPYEEGLISHTEDVRRRWDRVYFSRWFETHPAEFKQRLAELR